MRIAGDSGTQEEVQPVPTKEETVQVSRLVVLVQLLLFSCKWFVSPGLGVVVSGTSESEEVQGGNSPDADLQA
jgi:hypothetical protein